MKLFYAKDVESDLTSKIQSLLGKIRGKSVPRVALLYNRDASDSVLYTKVQRNKLKGFSIECISKPFSNSSTQSQIISMIKVLNSDKKITGISINFPLPPAVKKLTVFEAINPFKDIEGLNPVNMGQIFYGEPVVIPSVVLACQYVIEKFFKSLKGLNICIVNDSTLIGKPLSMLLLGRSEDAPTVTILNKFSGDVSKYTSKADILITAVGIPGLIKGKHVKKGAVILDAGIRVVYSKVMGDVDIKGVSDKAKIVTAVPGGLGVISQYMFIMNILSLCRRNNAD
ncbi:MAG: bifunctional 5,10-methylenetetrahydrofolate dehydrogenase/5,10-methenyltetrahydrofolate cyclohydrolase [Planctomycetes bacterium]|nr:bifunctional 5,10-methylenetetrahydrofolate dehydrogenase/5,10-methenyltetrahydrofolate cyclohydrolase [Planctomycetota bacterium]